MNFTLLKYFKLFSFLTTFLFFWSCQNSGYYSCIKKNEYHFEVSEYNISRENNNNSSYEFKLTRKNDSVKIENLKLIRSVLDGYIIDTLPASLKKIKSDSSKNEIKMWVKSKRRIMSRKLVFLFPTTDSITKFQGTESIDFHPGKTF